MAFCSKDCYDIEKYTWKIRDLLTKQHWMGTKWMRWKASNETVTRLPQNWRRLKATGRQSKENAPRSHIELFPLACIFRIAFIHFNLYRNIFRIILVIKIELSVPSACRERDFIDFECWLCCSIKSNHLLFAVSLCLFAGERGFTFLQRQLVLFFLVC